MSNWINRIILTVLVLNGASAFSGYNFGQSGVFEIEKALRVDPVDIGMFRGDGTFGTTNQLMFQDLVVTTPVSLQSLTEGAAFGVAGRYTLTLLHKTSVNNNTFIGYSEGIPGDDTPIIVVEDGTLLEVTFSNKNASADFTLEFRKNSTTATPFKTIVKTNTRFFVDLTFTETFLSGDEIYIKYIDNGTNASGVAIVLFFQNAGS